MQQEMSELEQLVAYMFFGVGIKAAMALEDPNERFGIEFQHPDALNMPRAPSFDAIAHNTYAKELPGGTATLITNPKDMPAIVRVVMQGGNPQPVMASLDRAFSRSDKYFVAEGEPFPVRPGAPIPEGSGNRFLKLILAPAPQINHDVAVLFAWGGVSDKRISLDLMTWPIDKPAGNPT